MASSTSPFLAAPTLGGSLLGRQIVRRRLDLYRSRLRDLCGGLCFLRFLGGRLHFLGGLRSSLAGEPGLALLLGLDRPLQIGVQGVQVVLGLGLGLGCLLFVIHRFLDRLDPARSLGLELALALLQILLGRQD